MVRYPQRRNVRTAVVRNSEDTWTDPVTARTVVKPSEATKDSRAKVNRDLTRINHPESKSYQSILTDHIPRDLKH